MSGKQDNSSAANLRSGGHRGEAQGLLSRAEDAEMNRDLESRDRDLIWLGILHALLAIEERLGQLADGTGTGSVAP
jgi:hypothetical protein